MSCLALLLASTLHAAPDWPPTPVERTGFARTSTVAEVADYMGALGNRTKALKPYRPAGAPSCAEAGAPLLAWRIPATGKAPLRVYLNGNIHAGEVEGKEALLQFVRALLQGKHPELREACDFVVMPAYNADGTDALDPAIRRYQPNPASGVGRRENARGLDLNRDLMKAEGYSTQFFLAMMRDFDPHLVIDLHTTNGSLHTFHLTYAHAQPLGGDEVLSTFNHRMVNEVRAALKPKGLDTYEYGDFVGGEPGRNGGTPKAWGSFDPRPRYLTNYPGLVNRLGVLSECFVYKSYADRIRITHDFMVACLEWAAAHRTEVTATLEGVARRWREAWSAGRPTLPLQAVEAETERFTFEAFVPVRNADGQVVGEQRRERFELPVMTSFTPKDFVPVPDGYLVDPVYAPQVKALLQAHGITVLPGSQRPKAPLRFFQESGRDLGKDAYQGVFNLTLKGHFKAEEADKPRTNPWRPQDLDRALYVPLNQAKGRLAFYLLDPRSNDGLVHWGVFHSTLVRGRGMWGEPLRFPIAAVGDFQDATTGGTTDRGPHPKAE